MFINRADIITLRNFSISKEPISVDSIPVAFKNDFQLFFFGKTLLKKDDLIFAYPHDIKLWIQFMFNKYKG